MRRKRDDQFPDNGFEAWGGYMQAKIAKLEEQFDERMNEDKESNLFEGISIYVNGYTKPSSGELKVIMSKNGGTYHAYQRTGDFIIASNLPDTKVKRLTTAKIVRPEWITDSLAAKCVLDYKQYLLYSKHTKTQPRLQFNKQSASYSSCDINVQNATTENIKLKNEKQVVVEIPETLNEKSPDSKHFVASDSLEITNKYDLNKQDSPEIITYEEPVADSKNSQTKVPDDNDRPPSVKESISLSNTNQEYAQQPSRAKSSVQARTAVDPNFLSEFYNNSRLHHISQLGATFKQYVNELRENSDFIFPARSRLKNAIDNLENFKEPDITAADFQNGRLIMHIDMDCFFVSVGLRGRPGLRGAPVAVTHARGGHTDGRTNTDRQTEFNLYRRKNAKAMAKATGVPEETLLQENALKSRVDGLEESRGSLSEIASCSYEARAKGVRNGMFVGAALKLCPELITIPYDFDGYKEVAFTLYDTVAQYTLDVEAVSCDELFADLTELARGLGASANRLAAALRQEIRDKTGCPCSAGFGANKLQARLATKKAKPDGQFFLTSGLVHSFMAQVMVSDLPGVGRQLLARVSVACGGSDEELTCAALLPLPLPTLQRHVGAAAGKLLYAYCRGDDNSQLNFHKVRKSVSAEVNYGIRLSSAEERDSFLRQLCVELHSRLVKTGCVAKSITLKLMVRAADAPVETAKFMGHGFCDTVNRSSALPLATDDVEVITRHAMRLCCKMAVPVADMRGVGLQLAKLEPKRRSEASKLRAFLVPDARTVGASGEKRDAVDAVQNGSEVNSETISCRTPTKKETEPTSSNCIPVKLALKSPSRIKSSPGRSPQKTPPRRTLGVSRRRGRPPKAYVPARAPHNDLMRRFLAGQTARHTPFGMEAIDPEILEALPEDIRREVLEYYQPAVVPSAQPSVSKVSSDRAAWTCSKDKDVPDSKAVVPSRVEVVSGNTAQLTYEESETVMDTRGPLAQSWRETRRLLGAWLAERPPRAPRPAPAALLSSYLQNMVIERNIDRLASLLNFFRRKVEELQDIGWSRTYSHIVEGIQQTMIAVYGKPLLIDR